MSFKRDTRSGIYSISHTDSETIYIGSAENIKRRWAAHRHLLTQGRHPNTHLQRAWTKYGAKAFDWHVVEYVPDKKLLIKREQAWIDRLDKETHYNVSKVAGSRLGTKQSTATRQKISKALTGKKRSQEAKDKTRQTRASKPPIRPTAILTRSEAAIIRRDAAAKVPHRILASQFNVSTKTISNIARGLTWTDVPPAPL